MTGIRSRARQLSLSLAGILASVLLLGPAFVPQELRADAASRFADLVEYFDTTLSDAWYSAFPSRGSDHRAGVTASHNGPHSGAPPVLTGGEAYPSEAASESFIDINGLWLDSFNARYGAGSNSIDGLLRDLLKDNSLGTSGGFEAFAGGSGAGNAPTGSGGDRYSGGAGASTSGATPASPSRSSSSNGSPVGSAASRSKNSEGTVRFTDVKPDAYQDRTTGLGNDSVSVYDDAGASWEQVASGQSLNSLFSNEPGGSDWNGGSHGGGAGVALDPTNGDVVGKLLNGLDHPFQGDDLHGSVFQNEVDGGANSDGGDGHLLDFKNAPDDDYGSEDHGPSNNTVVTGPDSGPLSGVPEPGSLMLLSLGLMAVILWGKFRSAH